MMADEWEERGGRRCGQRIGRRLGRRSDIVCIDVLGLALVLQPIIPRCLKPNTTSSADSVQLNFLFLEVLRTAEHCSPASPCSLDCTTSERAPLPTEYGRKSLNKLGHSSGVMLPPPLGAGTFGSSESYVPGSTAFQGNNPMWRRGPQRWV